MSKHDIIIGSLCTRGLEFGSTISNPESQTGSCTREHESYHWDCEVRGKKPYKGKIKT